MMKFLIVFAAICSLALAVDYNVEEQKKPEQSEALIVVPAVSGDEAIKVLDLEQQPETILLEEIAAPSSTDDVSVAGEQNRPKRGLLLAKLGLVKLGLAKAGLLGLGAVGAVGAVGVAKAAAVSYALSGHGRGHSVGYGGGYGGYGGGGGGYGGYGGNVGYGGYNGVRGYGGYSGQLVDVRVNV